MESGCNSPTGTLDIADGKIVQEVLTFLSLVTRIFPAYSIQIKGVSIQNNMQGRLCMDRISTKKIALNGLMIALVFLTTYFTRLPEPIPPGYVNIGDAAIMIAAIVLGKSSGFIAGSIGSCLADLISGAFIYAPITFIVKGVEGFVIGLIMQENRKGKPGELFGIIAVVAGAAIMVAGYFLAESYILGIFDKTFGYTAAVANLPLNLVQGGVSAIIGYVLSTLLIRINIGKYIRGD